MDVTCSWLGLQKQIKRFLSPHTMSKRIRWYKVLIDLSFVSLSADSKKAYVIFMVACIILWIFFKLRFFFNMQACANKLGFAAWRLKCSSSINVFRIIKLMILNDSCTQLLYKSCISVYIMIPSRYTTESHHDSYFKMNKGLSIKHTFQESHRMVGMHKYFRTYQPNYCCCCCCCCCCCFCCCNQWQYAGMKLLHEVGFNIYVASIIVLQMHHEPQ